MLGPAEHTDRPEAEHVEDFTFRMPCFAPALHSMLIFRIPLVAHSHLVQFEHLDPTVPIVAIPALTTLTALPALVSVTVLFLLDLRGI